MSHNTTTNRRQFLATGAALLAMPTILPRSVFGANERIVTGHVGVKNQGTNNLNNAFLKIASVGAVCDVDRNVLATAAKLVEGKGKKPQTYHDYRELLDRKDIDAVVITVPDHWHALITIHACQAGKDVYCEKPLSLTVAEGRKMVDAARKNDRVVQTGSQQRSDLRFVLAAELVRAGKIGTLKQVLVGIPKVNWSAKDPVPVPDSAPPPELDYDFWLGPAPKKPYNEKHVHYNFRFFWDYSGGQTTNFGAHHLDIAQLAMGMDDSGPVSIDGTAEYDPQRRFEVPTSMRVTYTYANGVKVVLGQEQKDIPQGCTFIGTDGEIFVDRSKIKSKPGEIAEGKPAHSGKYPDMSAAHQQNFLDCIKSRKRPAADVEIGHRSATVCHLGNIVARIGRKIQWDPSAERIVGDEQAASMLSRPYRSPYTI